MDYTKSRWLTRKGDYSFPPLCPPVLEIHGTSFPSKYMGRPFLRNTWDVLSFDFLWLSAFLTWLRDHTQTHQTTFCRTPLDEWLARRKDPYLTKHSCHNRQIFMPPAGFEPTIPASERQQTRALNRAATRISPFRLRNPVNQHFIWNHCVYI